MTVITPTVSVVEQLLSVYSSETKNLNSYTFKDYHKMETAVTRWLIRTWTFISKNLKSSTLDTINASALGGGGNATKKFMRLQCN
jgi:hypothetical protein